MYTLNTEKKKGTENSTKVMLISKEISSSIPAKGELKKRDVDTVCKRRKENGIQNIKQNYLNIIPTHTI